MKSVPPIQPVQTVVVEPAYIQPQSGSVKFCPNCGAEIGIGHQYCESCGFSLKR